LNLWSGIKTVLEQIRPSRLIDQFPYQDPAFQLFGTTYQYHPSDNMLLNFTLFTALAGALAAALPTEPAATSEPRSLSTLSKREHGCRQGTYDFNHDELQYYYDQLLDVPWQQHTASPLSTTTTHTDVNLKVIVQNDYVFQTQTYTNEQLARALSYIFCCDSKGHCSAGRAKFPSGEGDLIVFACNIKDENCVLM
jgi:hypothetical protein